MGREQKGQLTSHLPAVRAIHLKVDGTGTAAIKKGAGQATLTDNNTGDYTLTFDYPGYRFLGAAFTPVTKVYHHLNADPSTPCTAIRILTFNDAGAATDAIFYITVFVTDSQYDW